MRRLAGLLVMLLWAPVGGAATLTIINADGANEGFNSNTAATPVGGNPGTTLGQQRLIVFQRAAEIWGQRLTSSQTIKIEASFDALACSTGSAVLGSAGPTSLFAHTFGTGQRLVPVALREALAMSNLNGNEPEIKAEFNASIDSGCMGAQRWWYGIDPNETVPANRIPLLSTVLHELGHGLGFISAACLDAGGCGSNWPQGGYPGGILDRWSDFQRNQSSGQLWSAMSNAQRIASATSVNQLVWNGTQVTSALSSIPVAAAAQTGSRIKLHAPATLQPGSSVSHFTLDSNAPDLLMEPIIGGNSRIDQLDLAAALFADIGWTVSGGSAPTATSITSDTPDPSAVGAPYTVSTTVTRLGPTGTVSGTVLISDGAASCTTGALVGGSASCSLVSTSSGNKTLVATYSGNSVLAPSSDVEAHGVINAVNTTTVINSDVPDPSVVGQSYTVSVTVARASGTGAAPTGTVVVSEGEQTCTITLSSGGGSCALQSLQAGNRSLVATYGGAVGFNGSSSSPASHTVNKASTTLAITADTPDPSVSGQPVTVSFALAVSGAGSGTPGGSVTVNGAAGESCVALLPATSCSIVLVNAGSRTLVASYAGDANYNGSTSSGAAHTVNRAAATVAITADTPDPSVVGQNVSVSAQVGVVAPGTGTPDGTVTIQAAGSTATCSFTLPASTCNLPIENAGSRPLTASYSGSSNFNAATSAAVPHAVSKANTSISVVSDTPDPSASGSPVTVTFQLQVSAPGAGTPGGTVTVSASGGSESCVAILPASSCDIILISIGPRQLRASYAGDANYNASTSTNVPHTVTAAQTTTSILSSTPNPSVHGQPYSVALNVSAVGGSPQGASVNVTDNAGATCVASLNSSGNGSCTLQSGSPGERTLRATYSGGGNFQGSNGTRPHTIDKAPSTLSLVSSTPNPSNPGQVINVRFALQAAAPGAGTPTGTVSVQSSSGPSCSAQLPATACTLVLNQLGEHTLSLSYGGDVNFLGAGPVSGAHVVTADLLDAIFADGFD